MISKKRIISISTAFILAASVSYAYAEESKSAHRFHPFSIFIQGGVDGFHGSRLNGIQSEAEGNGLGPQGEIGFSYRPVSPLRIGIGAGYTGFNSKSGEIPRNAVGADLTAGIDLLGFNKSRKSDWFNIWVGGGIGYMFGWETGTDISLPETTKMSAAYIPMNLSLEFDLVPQVTLALYGKYDFFPVEFNRSPLGLWNAGIGLRFNIGGGGRASKAPATAAASAAASAAATVSAETAVSTSTAATEATPEAVCTLPEEPILFPAAKPDTTVAIPVATRFAVQIAAFRTTSPSPDDKMFKGDHPVIFKNGDLRRYVIFAGNYEQALEKLIEVLPRYNDAFIVYIDDDGIVKPIKPHKK